MRYNFLNKILQNTARPEGFWGRMMLRGMNFFHSFQSKRGLSTVEWEPDWHVLDIGCGGGANLKRLLKLCHRGQIYGIDISEESVRFSRRRNSKELEKRCFISVGNVNSLPFGDSAFDAVTAFETVYFWTPAETAFNEVLRVLKDGGIFLISVEMNDPDHGEMWTKRIEGLVVHSPETLKAMLEKAGFSNIRTVTEKFETHIISQKPQSN